MRIFLREKLDGIAVEGGQAGSRVRDGLADEERNKPGKQEDAQAPSQGDDPGGGVFAEARAGYDVAVPCLQGLLQAQQVAGIVLSVAVAAQDNLVAVPVSVDEAGLHGRADAHVVGQRQHHGAGLARDRGGVVA